MLRAVILPFLLGLSAASYYTSSPVPDFLNVFDMVAMASRELFYALDSVPDLMLDNRTDSGLISELDMVFNEVINDVCATSTNKACKKSPYMGCACKKAFQKLEKGCRDLPCNMVTYLYENLNGAIHALPMIENFEDLVRLGVNFITPIIEMLCPCNPGVYDAAVKCARKYDGDGDPEESEMIRQYARKIDLKSMKFVMVRLTETFCGRDGQCVWEFGEMAVEVAAMFDRSSPASNGDHCKSLRRLSDVIVSSFENTSSFSVSQMYGIVGEFWCGEKECAGHLGEVLNTCCTRFAVKRLDKKVLERILKFVNSILLLEGDNMLELDKDSKGKILEMLDPEKMCKNIYGSTICSL